MFYVMSMVLFVARLYEFYQNVQTKSSKYSYGIFLYPSLNSSKGSRLQSTGGQFRIILYPTLFNDSVGCYITLNIYLNHRKIDIIVIPLINILNYSIVFEASIHMSFFNFHLFNYYFIQQSKFNFLTNHMVL